MRCEINFNSIVFASSAHNGRAKYHYKLPNLLLLAVFSLSIPGRDTYFAYIWGFSLACGSRPSLYNSFIDDRNQSLNKEAEGFSGSVSVENE